jgi:hypothetical protein
MCPMRGYRTIIRTCDDPVAEWINERVRAIRVCLESGLPEAALTLIYSGVDTVGLLDAPTKKLDADRNSFITWAEHYVAPLLQTIDGDKVRAKDLYSARCGILHVSSPTLSDKEVEAYVAAQQAKQASSMKTKKAHGS